MAGTRRTGDLTGTSFALLGLLAARPEGWSAYELAQQMHRSLNYFWPRAQRNLYDEVKLLADRGLAVSRNEQVGKRPRTVYAITDQGRRELRSWLAKDSAPLTLESEALLRVFFADNGTVEDLLAAIDSIRQQAAAEDRAVAQIVRGHGTSGGPFPHRLHLAALMGELMHSHRQVLQRWADWAEHEVRGWSSTVLGEGARLPDGVFDRVVQAAGLPGEEALLGQEPTVP